MIIHSKILLGLIGFISLFAASVVQGQTTETAQIIFLSDYFTSGTDAFAVATNGENFRVITNVLRDLQVRDLDGIACSPDGDYLVFSIGRGIYKISPDNSNLIELSLLGGGKYDLSWSPDGTKIAFWGSVESDGDGLGEIYVMDTDGSNLQRLTNNDYFDRYPSWSPDGQTLAFSYANNVESGISIMDADGSNSMRLTTVLNDLGYDAYPTWSPDGQWIAFVEQRNEMSNIYKMPADRSGLVQLTSNAGNNIRPRWSPNGTLISFTSDRIRGTRDIYVMNPDGTSQIQVTDNPQTTSNLNECWLPLTSSILPPTSGNNSR